ncbi:uncharacterized protein LOC132051859 isoform X1 [Lycium ferocissimum]|uniref:uncharacterized protein LOC132051859 isoform X1 n=1 Tax=Lycium ferocissimum TaxID=112874 RepID=UPI002814BEF1|nr:uncharacterized protein LOC132051859 isoform X1 [Lycium ferocissimum]
MKVVTLSSSYFVDTHGPDAVYPMFSQWFREYVHNPVNYDVHGQFLRDIAWGPDAKVRKLSKYFLNGYRFHTEEWSKGKKTNNSGVWVKGDGDVDYYGVLQEILELEYPIGWPKKKLVLFRCKWYDPTPRSATKVHRHYKIVEIKHTREYGLYDPFVIAQNMKQVYYAPYPLCKNQSAWRVVIKTKPVGRVEVEDALDVAYQNDISSVEERVDDELAGELQHSEGLYEEFDPSELRLNLNDYGEGTSRANEEKDSADEYGTSKEELLDENETSDEEELMNEYESNEED